MRHLLSVIVSLVLCRTWDTMEATPRVHSASWLVICVMRTKTVFDLSKKCAVSVPRKKTRNVRHLMRWTRDERTCSACESDWAGDRHTRKSAFCVACRVDGCVMSVICRGQLTRLRSTAEPDESSTVNGLSCRSICAHASRDGRTRPFEVNALWAQDETRSKHL